MLDGDDGLSLKKKLLEEMAQFAQAGMARDMRQRFGKPLDDAPEGADEAMPEEAPENPEIPGVEASEAKPGEEMAEGELDAETLQALLASMKGG